MFRTASPGVFPFPSFIAWFPLHRAPGMVFGSSRRCVRRAACSFPHPGSGLAGSVLALCSLLATAYVSLLLHVAALHRLEASLSTEAALSVRAEPCFFRMPFLEQDLLRGGSEGGMTLPDSAARLCPACRTAGRASGPAIGTGRQGSGVMPFGKT